MNLELELAKLQGSSDQYRSLLRDVLMNLGVKRSFEALCDLEKEFHDSKDMGEKIILHAALVGMATTLFDAMQDEVANAIGREEGGEA